MFDENLLCHTKTILKYLISNRLGYQTVFSLNFDFYNYSGLNIPFYDLGYGFLVTFLKSIPDILTVNPLTLEVQPSVARGAGHQTTYTSQFPYYSYYELYNPSALPWTQPSYNVSKPKRTYQPIPIKKQHLINENDASTLLDSRISGDGKCSSPESIKSERKVCQITEPQHQTFLNASEKTLTLTNCCSDTLDTLMNGSNSVPTNGKNQNVSDVVDNVDRNNVSDVDRNNQYDDLTSVQSQTVLKKDQKEVEVHKERDVNEPSGTSSFTSSSCHSYSVENQIDLKKDEENLKEDDSCSLGSMELIVDDDPPPPYSEDDYACNALVYDRLNSIDYDLHYYLSSPEEKNSPVSPGASAIPFIISDVDDAIFMLGSKFNKGTYGATYKTSSIDKVMNIGGFYELYISEVNNPYKFWFQLDEESPNSIEELQEQLNMYYTLTTPNASPDLIKTQHIKSGYACAALYDNIWHRGEVQGLPKDGKVKIFFVDYGTVDQVAICDVRYLLDSFCFAPKFCHRGTLDFVQPLSYRWHIDATLFFIGLVENKKLFAGVSEIDIKTNSVRLYLIDRENNININYEVVRQCFAYPEDPRDRFQLHFADALPTFDNLEKCNYPSLAEVINLMQKNYDVEKLMEASIIADFDCIIPPHISDEETYQRVEAYKKAKEEAKTLAKQRDASVFLQFFGTILKNPFLNGAMREKIVDETETLFSG